MAPALNSLSSREKLIGFAGIVCSYFLLKKIFGRRKPPGPLALPLVGNLYQMLPYIKKTQVFKFLAALRPAYGRISQVQVLSETVVVISDATVAKRILTDEVFVRGRVLESLSRGIMDHALPALPTGEEWYRHRKFIQPVFAPSKLRQAELIIDSKIKTKIEYFKSLNGAVVQFHHEIAAIALDTIGLVAFGHNFKFVDLNGQEPEVDYIKHLAALFKVVEDRYVYPEFLWKMVGLASDQPKAYDSKSKFDVLIDGVIRKRREEVATEFGTELQKDWNMLDRLLYDNIKSKTFTEAEFRGEMIGFFAAGLETTSHGLTWAALELCQRPDMIKRLRDELDPLMTGDVGEELAAIMNSPFLERFVNEVLRFHPVVTEITRDCRVNCTIYEYNFKKGQNFIISVASLHSDPLYWDEPEVFNPDRFLNPVYPGAYLPFGEGPMKCIGFKLALQELKICLARLVHEFDFEIEPNQNLEGVVTITHGLKSGLYLRLHSRQ